MALFANTCVLLLLSVLCVFYLIPVKAIKPDDEIYLTNFNESFYLANETFTFDLIPVFQVPRQVLRHTIYTSSRDAIQTALKRAILEEPGVVTLSAEDHEFVNNFLADESIPIKVDRKKRSLPLVEGGVRIVPITSKVTLISSGGMELSSLKRSTTTPLGESICLHVPFFTTCDNSEDLTEVKNALQTAVDAIHKELDDYKKVNDERSKALAQTLNVQREIIDQLASLMQTQNELVANVAEAIQTNAAQIMDGDYQIHSQVNYLKRITDSLLKYSNALASTDPRATTAQPAVSKLFQGYIATMQNLTTAGFEAIVDNTTSFTWTETLLPSQSVSNITDPPCKSLTGNYTCDYQATAITRKNPVIGFTAVFSYSCTGGSPNLPACVSPGVLTVSPTPNWIYGPFHKNHYGIYSFNVTTSSNKTESVRVMRPIVTPRTTTNATVAVTITAGSFAYCVNFLGYKMFSSVYDPSISLVNSYKPPLPDYSDCDAMRLLDADYHPTISAGILPTKLWSLYGETEGIVVPFYSNCNLTELQNALYITNPGASVISTINYICSNGWTSSQPTPLASVCNTVSPFVINSDVWARHWVSSTCYINLEPGWLQLDYYVNPPLLSIPNIPRGYNLNQFTINAFGELASSLEFVYTDSWLPVYTIKRTSINRIITDEISLLDGSPVLFYIDQNVVIDESDAFFGRGNNGRDCIRRPDTYDYNLLNCFYQNLSPSYPPNLYLSGTVSTSGISRYNSKFDFAISTDNGISFALTPKKDLDFAYYVQMDGNVCPLLINQITKTSGCIVKLYYLDKAKIVILSPTGSSSTTSPVTVSFLTNSTKDVSIGIGTWTVGVGGKQCFILDCSYTIQFNVVKVTTPNVEIRTAADKQLIAAVEYSSTSTLAATVTAMERVISNVSTANEQIDQIRNQLRELQFDPSTIYPYENFTDLRNDVYALIDKIPTNPDAAPARNCDGPLNSIECWFADFLGVIVGVGLIVVILIILFCVAKKTGLLSKMSQGPSGKGHSAGRASHIPEYRAD